MSIALHGGVILVVLALSSHLKSVAAGQPRDETVQFLYPLLRPAPRPVEERLGYVGLNGMVADPLPVKQQASEETKPVTVPLQVEQIAVQEVKVPEPPRTFSELEVDSAAARDPESVGPTYPPKLLEAKLEGSTVVRFVVDSTGQVDVRSLVILNSTHPDFTQAVVDALPRMKYRPARLGSHHVAQLVEQRFGFRIAPPDVLP